MIAGLPASTWVLMVVAVVPGIALVAVAYRVHREGDREDAASGRGDAQETTVREGGGRGPQAPQATPNGETHRA